MPDFVLDLPYADLVRDTPAACATLLDFCGLPFEAACLDHTSNRSSVATLSSAQVREPIHARGLGEWRRYERQLQPLRELLDPDRARHHDRPRGKNACRQCRHAWARTGLGRYLFEPKSILYSSQYERP